MSKSRKPAATKPMTISEQLRTIIADSGMTAYAIGKAAGVDPGVIARFVQGERSLTLTTVDRIGAALDMVLAVRPGSTSGDEQKNSEQRKAK